MAVATPSSASAPIPHHATSVTWQTARGSIEQLGTVTVRALDGLHTSTGAQDAAAIAWIGDTGALHRDLAAFHATRQIIGRAGAVHRQSCCHPCAASTSAPRLDSLAVSAESGTHVVAHRGASHDFPEQTRAAYTEALRQGADALECDVRLTKDGELVLIHDKTVDRTSNGTGRVGDMTLAELQALDFDGHGILTLDEFIQLAQDADRPVTLFIETKHPAQQGLKIEREVVAALERHGLANPGPDQLVKAAVISFYPDALLRVRMAAPNVPTVLSGTVGPLSGRRGGRDAPSVRPSKPCATIPNSSARRPRGDWPPTAGRSTTKPTCSSPATSAWTGSPPTIRAEPGHARRCTSAGRPQTLEVR